MSSSIESKLEQIEQSIQEDQQRKAQLGKRAKTFAIIGGICLLGVVIVKAPIFLLGAAVGGAGLAVTTWMRGEVDTRLNSKYQTQATLMIAQEAARSGQQPSAGLSPDAGIRSGFAQNASGPNAPMAIVSTSWRMPSKACANRSKASPSRWISPKAHSKVSAAANKRHMF